jgi:amino acid adenylation domain-containing protein
LAEPDDLAYVIYTSGSTGRPKGVELPHRAVTNFLSSVARAPGIAPDDVLLAVTTLSFDIAVLELYLPLIVGAKVIIASREQAADGGQLLAAIRSHRVTLMQATPSTWRLLLEAGWSRHEPMKVLCGGEALPIDLARELVRASPSVWNMYGPTETTVWSTTYRLPEDVSQVLIGRPLANTEVHVLDAEMQPVCIGVRGELYVGGDGLARGYLGRPDLTRERFVADPSDSQRRLYRTGDVVRFRADGNLEYLGRNDQQVKLRGYRIELGEIESVLANYPGVSQVAAVIREVKPGDTRLIAFVVPESDRPPTDEQLRAHLRGSLPEYMVPQHFATLAQLPLTPNGKVDRKALSLDLARDGDDEGAYVAPRTATERTLAEIWQQALGVARLGVHDDFFQLGGHSLLAAQVLSRVARDHGVSLSLRRMFEAPTIAQLAAAIDRESASAGPRAAGIPRRRGTGPAPQSVMQQRLWVLEQMQPDLNVHNLPAAYRLRGALDVAALKQSFATIVARHDVLRTTLAFENDQAIQRVASSIPVELGRVDLSDRLPAKRESELLERLQAEADTPFDLTRGPLFRTTLYRLDEREHVLFFMTHHVIWDGWSFDTFMRELDTCYALLSRGHSPDLPPLPIQYADFAEWHSQWLRGDEMAQQASYWKAKLAGELPPLELPTDYPRPAVGTGGGGFEPLRLSADELGALVRVARDCGVTVFMVLFAAFLTMIHRYTGQDDLLVGTPVRGRTQPETEDLLGFFVNTLVIRGDLSGSPSFRELLQRVRAVCLEAFAHPDMPFERLVRDLNVARDLSRTPLFQTFFSFQDATARKDSFGDLQIEQLHLMPQAAQTDLTLWVMQRTTGVVGGISYSTDLFEAETARRFLYELHTLLAGVVRDLDQSIASIPLLPDRELRQLESWNATEEPFELGASLPGLVTRQANATPDRVAALDESLASLTFGDLDRRSNRLARRLRAMGVRRGDRVGLFVDRSTSMLVAMLGVLKSGAAYVPLDAAFPPERLVFMADDAKLAALLTFESLSCPDTLTSAPRVLLDRDAESIARESDEPLAPDGDTAGPDDAAYVIYTSGSTGKPKGVCVPHRAVVNFLATMAREPGIGPGDVLLAVTTLSFDIAVLELYLPLVAGAKVVIASRDTASDGSRLLALMRAQEASIMQATPSTWRMLLDAGWSGAAPLKVICGGEALPLDLGRALVARSKEVWNVYGPTETTVWSTRYRLPTSLDQILIGRPIGNTQCYVLDAQQRPVPIGVPGELYIGGDGVALGYLHQPELTEQRFLPDPFRAPPARMYRTGDVVRWRPTGHLEYIGRNDHQVKLRGYRIELGEIETRLAEHSAVREVCAVVRHQAHREGGGDARLVAYYALHPGQAVTSTDLRKLLRSSLPEYMVPQAFLEIETLPRTPNGKVDRKALPAPFDEVRAEAQAAPPRTPNERLMAEIWSELLGRRALSVYDNFFEAGGHSLLVLQAISRIEKRTGRRLNPRGFVVDTLEQLAAQLPSSVEVEPVVTTPEPKSDGTGILGRVKRLIFR